VGCVCFNFKERAKEHRGHVFKSEGHRESIWKILCGGLESCAEEEKDKPVAKKPRLEKDVVASAQEILDLF
jgi:hypothetical protein